MNRYFRPALAGLFGIALTGTTHALVCPGGPFPPRCFASSSSFCTASPSTQCATDADCGASGPCSIQISGSVSPGTNPINTIGIQAGSATNLTFTSTGPTTFTLTQTNTALDAIGIIEAKDTGVLSCTIDVTFHNRALGAPTNEEVCHLQEGYQVRAISGGSSASPAGTTTCSAVIAQCDDGPPAGDDFQSGSRILTVRSPIHSAGATPDVVTELTRDLVFQPNSRLAFARAASPGGAFGAFQDITQTVGGGPFAADPKSPNAATIIRGTGQWSDVKVGHAFQISVTPTLGEWGLIILTLLLMSSACTVLARRIPVTARAGGGGEPDLRFDRRLYVKALGATALLAGVSGSVAWALGWTPTATDLAGSAISAGVLGYLIHTLALVVRSRDEDRP